MSDLLTVFLGVCLVVVLALALPLFYVFMIGLCRSLYLSLRAFRARRRLEKAGGAEFLSDLELLSVRSRIDARLAFRPLYRNPSWVPRYAHLKERLDLLALSREAAALGRDG